MSTMQLAPDSFRFRKGVVTASNARSIPARWATRNEDPSRRVLSPPNWSVVVVIQVVQCLPVSVPESRDRVEVRHRLAVVRPDLGEELGEESCLGVGDVATIREGARGGATDVPLRESPQPDLVPVLKLVLVSEAARPGDKVGVRHPTGRRANLAPDGGRGENAILDSVLHRSEASVPGL